MLYLVGGWGGAERVDLTELFANHLAQSGFDIDWVVFEDRSGPAWRTETWRSAKAHVVRRGNGRGLAGAVASKWHEILADLRTTWLVLIGDYDIVQVRDKFIVGVLALMAARLRGTRFTYWLSYPFAECRIVEAEEGRARIPFFSKVGGKAAAWLLYHIIIPRSDHVFVQSQQMLQDIAEHGVDRTLMSPVPMAVSESVLEKPPRRIEPHTIHYLGTLARVRKLEILLDALLIVHKLYPEARLVFIGDGEVPEDRKYLEKETASRGLSYAVEFTGMLPMDQAHDRVQTAAICVSPFFPMPILLSTSPTKLIEYMALGRPVVANEHPEQSKVLEESRAGICVDWSARSFAESFVSLFQDPVVAEAMGRRGRHYVRSHRIYSLIAADVEKEYRRMFEPE